MNPLLESFRLQRMSKSGGELHRAATVIVVCVSQDQGGGLVGALGKLLLDGR